MRKLVLLGAWVCCALFVKAQDVDMIKLNQLNSLIDESQTDLTIVNFWATWCAPCIKELPYFEEADNMEGVKVLLVSLDFPEEYEKVTKFAAKKQLKPDLYLLDEKDYDSYMAKINESWSGAIPATLMVDKNGEQHFFEKAFTKEELFDKIEEIID